MEALKCPGCGSTDVTQVGYPEYECAHCGTRFVPTRAPSGFVDVVLVQTSRKPMDVIVALREVTRLDLAAAKRAAETAPAVAAQNVALAEGERIKARLEKAGAAVELKAA